MTTETISIQRTIPTSGRFYTLSGNDTGVTVSGNTVTLDFDTVNIRFRGVNTRIVVPIGKSGTKNDPTDSSYETNQTFVLNLKRVTETVNIQGYFIDGTTYSAHDKAFMLMEMYQQGKLGYFKYRYQDISGNQQTLTVDGSGSGSTKKPDAFINNLTWFAVDFNTGDKTNTTPAVILWNMEILFGEEK